MIPLKDLKLLQKSKLYQIYTRKALGKDPGGCRQENDYQKLSHAVQLQKVLCITVKLHTRISRSQMKTLLTFVVF